MPKNVGYDQYSDAAQGGPGTKIGSSGSITSHSAPSAPALSPSLGSNGSSLPAARNAN